jgi:hypothetical protein
MGRKAMLGAMRAKSMPSVEEQSLKNIFSVWTDGEKTGRMAARSISMAQKSRPEGPAQLIF